MESHSLTPRGKTNWLGIEEGTVFRLFRGPVLRKARYSGDRYWGFLQYTEDNEERMVARYSRGHGIGGGGAGIGVLLYISLYFIVVVMILVTW